MEQTLSALRDFLQSRSGFASILIAPTRSMGRQLLDAYAARFGGALGVRVHTPDTLALELCGADCPGLLSDGALLVLSLLRERGAEASSLPAARAVLADLQLLERENVLPAGNPRLAELSALLEAYRAEKARRGLWDRYDLFAAAAGRPLPAPAALCANVTGEGVVRTFLEGLHAAVLPVPSAGTLASAPALFLPQGEEAVSARLRFARGYGRENETLYPFYDLLERRIPFGQAAVLWAGRETRTLLREQAARLGVPLTLDGGVPLEEGTLLPLLRALAAWHEDGCPVEGLPGLMAGGLVPPHGAGLLRFLRKNHAGGGLSRCLDCLEGALSALPASGGGPEEETRGRLTDWLAFFRELEALFSPETGAAEGTALLGAFLPERYVKVQPQVRGAERAALLSALEAVADQASGSFCSLLPDLLDAAAGTPWQSASPRDGAVHAAPLSRGAFLDRPYTYILGLERDALTAPGRESFLLRDEERAALGLPRSDAGADLPAHHLGTVLAAAGGEVTLSYSCFDTEKLLSTPPSPAYERLRGQADPVLFGYRRPASLTGADRWLEGQGRPAPAVPARAGAPEEEALRDFVFSASSLELALDCPRRFYFQYLLQVPQEERTDPARRGWLPANAFGSLVHEALEDYFGLLIETKAPPDLEAVWAARLAAYERAWPCADPALRQREARRAKGCVLSAVRHFRESQADSVPLAVELTFGRKSAGGGPPELPEVFTLELDRETAFRFTGSVDRLDRLPSGALRLVDYKTGDPGKFYRDFSQKLQYFLYARALRQLAEGPVERAEYLFLSPGGVRTLGVKDPGGNQDCLARVKALMNLLRAGQALEAARPVWQDGALRWGGEDAKGRREICARHCPYAGLCEEVRP